MNLQEQISRIQSMMGFINEGKNNIQYMTWEQLKNETEFVNYPIVKAYFEYSSLEDEEYYGVTDIQQYGDGSYFCVTENCIEHYRENVGYIDEDYFEIPNETTIAVSMDDDVIYENYEEIKKNASGFYCPTYDTYGMVIWDKKIIKKLI